MDYLLETPLTWVVSLGGNYGQLTSGHYTNATTVVFLQIRQYDKKGGVSVAHIADDIQKQSKTFYLLFIQSKNIT